MASPAIHIQQGHVALTAVCARLGELLRVEAPTLPASSRFGTEATTRFQWESLLAWLQAQSPPIPDGLEVTKNEGGVFTIKQVTFADMGSTFVGDAPAESSPTDESAPVIAPAAEPVAVVSEAERLAGIYVSVTGVPLADVSAPPIEPEDFLNYTRDELVTLAARRGVAVTGSGSRGHITKDDITSALYHARLNA